MADNDVKIKLSLDGADSVEKGLRGVGDGANTSDSKLKGMVTGGLNGAGAALVGFAGAAVAAGGALTTSVVSAYADYEQNIGGIETMFKGASGKMEGYAADAYKTAGLSANQYMSQVTSFSASLLQGLGGDTNKAADVANTAMVDMSDNANKFGSNITDIQNAYQGFAKDNYTMLDNLKLGYGGTAAEMARLVNDSGVMGSSFHATAQNINDVSFDKIIEAIHTVQDRMGISGTTAKEAASTISGSIGMLQSSFANLITGLGRSDADVSKLAGDVVDSLTTVIKNIGPVIENLGKNMETLGPQMGSMIQSLVGVIVQMIPTVIQAGSSILSGFLTGVIQGLPGLITAIVPGLLSMVEMILTMLPMLVNAGIQAIIALGQGIAQSLPTLIPVMVGAVTGIVQTIIDNLPMILQVALQLIIALADGLLQSIPVLIEALPQIITSMVNFFIEAIPIIIQAGFQLITALIKDLPAIIVAIINAMDSIWGSIFSSIGSQIGPMINAGWRLLTSIVGNIGGAIGFILGKIGGLVGSMVGSVADGIGGMMDAGRRLVEGIWNGISGAAGWLWNKLSGWAGKVVDKVKGLFGINSPSKVMADEVGKFLPSGVGVGITKNEEAAIKPITNMSDKIVAEAAKLNTIASFTNDGTLTQQLVPMQATPTPSGVSTQSTQIVFSGPLVSIDSAQIRNDQDIRKLSTQLKTDMSRELRAQGVFA